MRWRMFIAGVDAVSLLNSCSMAMRIEIGRDSLRVWTGLSWFKMQKYPASQPARLWKLNDGRLKWLTGTHGLRPVVAARKSVRLSASQRRQLIERFAPGVPVYRQRFQPVCNLATAEKFCRVLRACCVFEEQWRRPSDAGAGCDQTTFGGICHGKTGWVPPTG